MQKGQSFLCEYFYVEVFILAVKTQLFLVRFSETQQENLDFADILAVTFS